MITAKQAFKKSKIGYGNYINRVKEIVKNELENDIAEKIETAMGVGHFFIFYWRDFTWFAQQTIAPEDYILILKEKLQSLGYKVIAIDGNTNIKIEIYWDQEEEEEEEDNG